MFMIPAATFFLSLRIIILEQEGCSFDYQWQNLSKGHYIPALHLLDYWGHQASKATAYEKFKMITISDRENPFDTQIYAWMNTLTDEFMNNTLMDFMSGIDFFSDQYFSYLPWCESAGVAIQNQSTSPALSREPHSSVQKRQCWNIQR